jgi:cytoplasmic FMR1 interacting protein
MQPQNIDQQKREEIYNKMNDLLKPEIQKMKSLKQFCDQVVRLVSDILSQLGLLLNNMVPSDIFLFSLIKTLDKIVVIDALKDMKTSLNNDFSMFKR